MPQKHTTWDQTPPDLASRLGYFLTRPTSHFILSWLIAFYLFIIVGCFCTSNLLSQKSILPSIQNLSTKRKDTPKTDRLSCFRDCYSVPVASLRERNFLVCFGGCCANYLHPKPASQEETSQISKDLTLSRRQQKTICKRPSQPLREESSVSISLCVLRP